MVADNLSWNGHVVRGERQCFGLRGNKATQRFGPGEG